MSVTVAGSGVTRTGEPLAQFWSVQNVRPTSEFAATPEMLDRSAVKSTVPPCPVIQVPSSVSPGDARNGDAASPSMKTLAKEARSSAVLPPTVENTQPGAVLPMDPTGPVVPTVEFTDSAAPGVAEASALAKTRWAENRAEPSTASAFSSWTERMLPAKMASTEPQTPALAQLAK